jgi:hypothetical protein
MLTPMTNTFFMGLMGILMILFLTTVDAKDDSTELLYQTKGTATIYLTCEGINFDKVSIRDGIVAARTLKLTFNEIFYKGRKEQIHKLVYTGPSSKASSTTAATFFGLRGIVKVGAFAGTWSKEWEGIWGLVTWAPCDDTVTVAPKPSPKELFEIYLASWEKAFDIEIRKTGRSAFANIQSCSIQYEKVSKK